MPDHPRSRGVYVRVTRAVLGDAGSSPLARGLLSREIQGVLEFGIIPARAGFTRGRLEREPALPDHPRSRGVYDPNRDSLEKDIGSSPLARGLLFDSRV